MSVILNTKLPESIFFAVNYDNYITSLVYKVKPNSISLTLTNVLVFVTNKLYDITVLSDFEVFCSTIPCEYGV